MRFAGRGWRWAGGIGGGLEGGLGGFGGLFLSDVSYIYIEERKGEDKWGREGEGIVLLPSLTLRSSGGLFSPPGPSGGRILSMLDSDFAGIWTLLGLNQVSGRLRGLDSGSVDVERLPVVLAVVFATDADDGDDDDDAPAAFSGDVVVDWDELCCEFAGGRLERK